MKIITEYYGQLNVLRRFNTGQIRHGDRRKSSRRQMIIPIGMERRQISDRRLSLERRTLLRNPWGIIQVYGSLN